MGFWGFLGRRMAWLGGDDLGFQVVSGKPVRRYINTATKIGQTEAYNTSSVVRSAINMRVMAYSNLRVWALNDRNRSVMNPTVKADLQRFEEFNEFQDRKRFSQYAMAHLMLYGKVYVWKFPIYGSNPRKHYYYVVPNLLIEPKFKVPSDTDRLFRAKADSYEVSMPWSVKTLILKPSEVEVYYDKHLFSTGFDEDLGSRLAPLDKVVSTLATIEDTRHQLTADAGARGIISLGGRDIDAISSPFLKSEQDDIQRDLKKYGSLRDQFKYIVTKGAATFTPMVANVGDMQLPESFLDSKLEVYTAFGIPSAYTEHETRYRALPEAKLMFYTDTVVPEGEDFLDFLLRLKEVPRREGWRYAPDWSHLDVYQDALAKKGSMLQQAAQGVVGLVKQGVFTREEGRGVMDMFLSDYIT